MPRGWGRKFDYEAPPRKPVSAYSFYVQDWYRYWRRVIRTRNPTRVIREVARQWKRQEGSEIMKYKELAKRDKERATRERLAYYDMIDNGELPLPPLRPRKTKQPGYPRSTKNAFVFFSNEKRDEIRRQNPNMAYVQVMRELGRRWKALSEAEKKQYRNRRDTDKARYNGAKRQFRQAQKEAKRKKRIQEGRVRLNRLFNKKVPEAVPQSPQSQTVVVH